MIKFLTLKHWQLFGWMVAVPIIIQFFSIVWVISTKNPTNFQFVSALQMILFISLFFGWCYALGTNLYKKLPKSVSLNLIRFKIFLFVPAIYILALSIYMVTMNLGFTSAINSGLIITGILVPVHLFSMFCIFYCQYFIAKALKSAEWQKPVTFSDFAGAFFLIWFFPIGVCFLQPRLNQLFDPLLTSEQLNNGDVV